MTSCFRMIDLDFFLRRVPSDCPSDWDLLCLDVNHGAERLVHTQFFDKICYTSSTKDCEQTRIHKTFQFPATVCHGLVDKFFAKRCPNGLLNAYVPHLPKAK